MYNIICKGLQLIKTGYQRKARQHVTSIIDFQINNFTALSVKILDDVHISTTYSDFSL